MGKQGVNGGKSMEFREFFTRATGCMQQPFPFQQQFAESEDLPRLFPFSQNQGAQECLIN